MTLLHSAKVTQTSTDRYHTVSIITTQQLARRYGRRVGIASVDLDVPEGRIFGFLGPNGAGKTTTIRILLGFLRPSGGGARIFDLDCWRQSHHIKQQVGYLPGDLRLYPWMTARRALQIVGCVRGLDLMAEGQELSDRFALPTNLRVRQMSRGMRQKLGLILALVHRPRLLVLDEPTSGLDPPMQNELANCLRERAAAGGTVFFSSHTLSEVEQLCDSVAIVRAGRVVAHESLATLRDRARRSVTIRFRDVQTAERIAPPDFLPVIKRSQASWHCELVGSAPRLIHWASQQPIEDVTIAPPNLESLFYSFYHDPEETP